VNVLDLDREITGDLHSGLIVWINAEKEVVLLIFEDGDVVPHHIADYFRFAPARNEDRDAPLRLALRRLLVVGAVSLLANG